MAEVDADYREYRQVFRMVDRQSRQSVPVADVWELLQQLPSARGMTSGRLEGLAGGSDVEVDEAAFVSLMAGVRKVVDVSVEKQVSEFNALFLAEVFRGIDTNRDNKISAAELGRFFESLNQKWQIPTPVTVAQIERYVQIADLSLRGFECDSFIGDVMEQFFDERKDIPVVLIVAHARKLQEERLQRKSAVGGLFGRVKDAVQSASPKRKEPVVGTPRQRSTSLSPTSTTAAKGARGFDEASESGQQEKGVLEKLGFSFGAKKAQGLESGKSPQRKNSGRTRSLTRQGPQLAGQLDYEDELHCQRVEFQEQLEDLRRQLRRRDLEVARLKETARKGAPAVSQKAAGDDSDSEGLSAAELSVALADLRSKYDSTREALEAAQENVRLAQEHAAAKEQQASQHTDRLAKLEAALADEQDRVQQLEQMRSRERDDDTRLRAQIRDLRTELRLRDEAVASLQERVSEAELAVQMAAIQSLESPVESPRGWRGTTPFVSDFGDGGGDEDHSEVVFLNPPRREEAVDTATATLFDEPGPICYNFAVALYPQELHFDVRLATDAVAEYLSCRDGAGQRSMSLHIDQGRLSVPCAGDGTALDKAVWVPVGVVFNWTRRVYSVHVGTSCVLQECSFRDKDSAGVQVFDVYPRRLAAVTYANIRFVT